MKRSKLAVLLLAALGLAIHTTASAQICPIEKSKQLPVQPGHPWTMLTKCVSGGNAMVGKTVNGADCTDVYVSSKQMLENAGALTTLTILSGGTLIFLDENYTVEVGNIIVNNGGTLQIGAQACPINNPEQVQIVFTGTEGMPEGIDVKAGGTLRMWGHHGNTDFSGVSWSHLAEPAGPANFNAKNQIASPVSNGPSTLVLDNAALNWKIGDWIVVAGTNYAPDSAEIVQIQALKAHPKSGTTTITIAQPLIEYHFGGPSPTCDTKDSYCGPSPKNAGDGPATNYGVDERAEVGLLTKSIRLTSLTPNPYSKQMGKLSLIAPQPTDLHWGGEVQLEAGFAAAEISGVEIGKFGGDQDGQFPLYFEGNGVATPIISSNSIHHSYNKCIALAGLTDATINDNVCTRITGDMFYLRTGAEQNLTFTHNLGVGAMSNLFTLNTDPNALPPYQLWWAGDNLTNHPTKKCSQPDGASGYNCFDGLNINFTDATPNTVALTSYTPAGFWITNPANSFQANSIAGCQDQGIGFWYDLNTNKINLPLGTFNNNRAHGCYYGLDTPAQLSTGASFTPQDANQLDLIAHFDGVTATRNRYIGIWARPAWYSFTNARLAGNVEGASLVSSGGTEGSPPGEWSQIEGATLVGESMNNPERFGPCPYYTDGVIPKGDKAPPPPVCAETPGAAGLGNGYPDPKRNELGYMFYDGPARIEDTRFVNFLVDPRPLLSKQDTKYLNDYTAIETMPCDTSTKFVYEGDAAMGWFQSNLNAYPPTQYTENVAFENVDLRHEVYTQEVGVTCIANGQGKTVPNFEDGDKNTVILDHDTTLSGYEVVDSNGQPVPGKFPISLNNLPFLAVADTTDDVMNTVDECFATGAQDQTYENRPTAQMSPNDYASLEFSAVPCALESGTFTACTNANLMTFTKDETDYGTHQSMSLNGRNNNGIYEPKVMNGLGYTIQPQFQMPPNVSITYTDATTVPFHTRLGLCYNTSTGPPQCPRGDCSSVFTVAKGVKTLGQPGTTNPTDLDDFFTYYDVCNGLDNQFGYPNLYNLPNLVYCLDPSLDTTHGDNLPPTPTPLTQVNNIADLTPTTYFYDQTTGLLFLDVQQELANGNASGSSPSPLGSCDSSLDGGTNDPQCPDENFYSCPSGGCELYMVQVSPTAYTYTPTQAAATCTAYPTYAQHYPALNFLKNVATSTTLTASNLTPTSVGSFPHLVDASGSPCPTSASTPMPTATPTATPMLTATPTATATP